MIQFDRLDTITHDCLDIWNITGVCNRGIAEETMKYVGQVISSDSTSSLSEDSVLDSNATNTRKLLGEVEEVLKERNLVMSEKPWGQIHRKYEATEMHHHGDNDVAWVYYVRVPEDSGLLVLSQFQGWTSKIDISHCPVVGQLVMIPGWMVHRVTKNFNDVPRISIAGNANYIGE